MRSDITVRRALLGLALTASASLTAGGLLCPAVVGAQALDRSKPPAAAPAEALRIPPIVMRKLANGIPVAVMENHEIPIVRVGVVIEAGGLLDPPDKDGLSSVTFAMLGEGTTTKTADQLADAEAALGSNVSATGFVTITSNLDGALALMADELLRPAFPQAALDRLKANRLAGLKRQKEQPGYLAQRVFANAVYGTGHPYERTETEASIDAITREDLVAFHDTWFRPQNAKLVIVGDITPDVAVRKLEAAFGAWPKGGKLATYDIPAPTGAGPTKIYLFDRPASAQSALIAGEVGPRRDIPGYFALDVANTILGGTFNSRLNLNLREKHGWSYGAGSRFTYRRLPQVGQFIASSQVATAKTDSSVVELVKELRGISGANPMSDSEVTHAKDNILKGMPLDFETVNQIAGAAVNVLANNLPLNYYQTLSAKYQNVTTADVRAAAAKYINPDRMAVVVVGDRKVIEEALRKAGIAPVEVVDEHAKPVGVVP